MQNVNQRENVREVLRNAFPNLIQNVNSKMTHAECVNVRSRLCLFRDDDISYVLSEVLEDLLDTHTNNPFDSEDVEAVIRHLDVMAFEDEYLRKDKLKIYSKFTPKQAFAVFKWLEFAKSWADVELLYIDDINSALQYWESCVEQNKR